MNDTSTTGAAEGSPEEVPPPLRTPVTRLRQGLRTLFKFLRRHPVITALCGIYLIFKLIGLVWGWILTPTINPHPQDPITISGTFPFDKGLDLVFDHDARSTAPWMAQICGWGLRDAGVPCQGGHQEVRPKKVDPTHYEVTFFRDHYLPGIAGWQHSGFGYRVQVAGSQSRLMVGLGTRFKEVKCLSSPNPSGHLTCIHADDAGPNVWDKATRNAELNFTLTPDDTQTKKGH